MSLIETLVHSMHRSSWQLVNSTGGQAGVGPLAAMGGVFDFRDTSAPAAPIQRLRYGALGVAAGIGVNFSLSGSAPGGVLPSVSSSIYTLPASQGRLSLADFRGHFIAYDLSASVGVTGGVTMIFLGASNHLRMAIGCLGPVGFLLTQMPTDIAFHKAVVITAGTGLALTPNAGFTIFSGQVL